jgi:hypothetical protein
MESVKWGVKSIQELRRHLYLFLGREEIVVHEEQAERLN